MEVGVTKGPHSLALEDDAISKIKVEARAEKLGYPSRNILLDRIDTHSNQVGGACEIKLAQSDD